jgi:hypothetical protein
VNTMGGGLHCNRLFVGLRPARSIATISIAGRGADATVR